MNLLLLAPGEVGADGTAVVTGARHAMLQRLAALRPAGEAATRVRAGVEGGRLGQAEVLALDDSRATVAVTLDAGPPPALPCTLVLALPRPKMLKRILVDATSLGVKQIHFTNAFRVEKSYWSSPLLEAAAIADKCRLGLEQAIDTVLPQVTLHTRFRPFVEDLLPAIAAGTQALLAHPAGRQPCPQGTAGPVTLAIGPEGGYIPFEVDLLQQAAGFVPVTLGPRVLRVDTAVPALLGRLFTR